MNSPPSPVKILITNIVTLNTGDAAILQGTIDILKKKYGTNSQILVFDKHASIAQKYYSWADFRQSLFSRPSMSYISRLIIKRGYGHLVQKFAYYKYLILALLIRNNLKSIAKFLASPDLIADIKEYVSADLIMSSGGTYLIENYNLLSAINEYKFSLAIGKKLGFFTMSLGPFTTAANRANFNKIFNDASVILLRDTRSKYHLSSIGVDVSRVHLCADAAFMLANHTQPQRNNTHHPPSIAISVRSMNYFYESKEKTHLSYYEIILTALLVAIEEFGAKVTFLSTCQGIKEYWTNDAATAREIYDMIPDALLRHVEIDTKFRQPDQIINTYQNFDVVIATRMHAAILSLCAGTPVVGIAYEFKMEELFRRIKQSEFLINIDGATKHEVTRLIRRALNNTKRMKTNTRATANRMRNDALTALNALPLLEN